MSDPARLPIDLLLADPANPRKITPEALEGLGASLEEFGDLSGLTWNETTGELVAGHQRLAALKRAGAREFVRGDGRAWVEHPETGERFPVRLVRWSPEQQRAANLAANNPAIAGEFTAAALEQVRALEDAELREAVRLDALEDLLAVEFEKAGSDEAQAGETDPDEVPPVPVKPTAERGDLWILGDHRLLCGDATNTPDVARVMEGQRAALCVTDPPYGVNFTDNEGKNIAADMNYGVIPGFFGPMVDVVAPGRALLFFGTETNMSLYGALMSRELRMRPRLLFWKKAQFVLRHHDYHSQYECIFYAWTPGGDARSRWKGGRDQADVWEVAHDVASVHKLHPTQKPVELFERAIRNHTDEGEICYEPFSGSGSQLIAGERLSRRVFALELDPLFVDVAVARWEAFTGRKAERQAAPPP